MAVRYNLNHETEFSDHWDCFWIVQDWVVKVEIQAVMGSGIAG